MSDWKPKRFWTSADVTVAANGFSVTLDGRPVKTPAKAPLILPTQAMADAVAAEWDAQADTVDPMSMPITRSVNAAIDKVSVSRPEVIAMLAEYGDSDLLCYRAAGPAELQERQAQNWDPVLDWAADTLGARLVAGQGIMHLQQDFKALAALRGEVEKLNNFALAGAHDLISISGSLVLALAVIHQQMSVDRAWSLSCIDEAWQTEQWGEDEEAKAAETTKRSAFVSAAKMVALSAPSSDCL